MAHEVGSGKWWRGVGKEQEGENGVGFIRTDSMKFSDNIKVNLHYKKKVSCWNCFLSFKIRVSVSSCLSR